MTSYYISSDEFAEALGEVLALEREAWRDEAEALRKRIAALENRPTLSYEGVYENGRTYERGMFVTDKGAMWIAGKTTASRPGGPDGSWKLAVKGNVRRDRDRDRKSSVPDEQDEMGDDDA